MAKKLVIVESPAKAKTISKFLGKDYKVLASMGHIRDLPKTTLGFDPEKNFKPKYVVSSDKKKIISEIKKNIKDDTFIFLASDEDREGEAISWHLVEALKIKKNYKRIVFHEITKTAIEEAIKNPRDINQNLVDAQQARRILDRAVGYKLSPLLWKKIKPGLSAGRVQSVAVRLIVDRENQIRNFIPKEFWKISADFDSFVAELVKQNGKKIEVNNEKEAKDIELYLKGVNFIVKDIVSKESKKNPSPPFTTSTLQQEASLKLNFSVKQTMMLAQQLYEGNFEIPNHTGGLITYMRTDSVNLSKEAINAIKKLIKEEYGSEFVVKSRTFKTKNLAQEAHEAIRPVNMYLKPSDVKPYLDKNLYRLYELIYKRTIATQMASAKFLNTTYIINAGEYEFQAKGQVLKFLGFLKVYNSTEKDKLLPEVKIDEKLDLKKLKLEQNFTKPPARYTEASLVKELEANGIGRPSTYAPTISTILQREYVVKDDKKLVPTKIGEIVNEFLVNHFSEIVDINFTARIEEEFDEIAQGKIKWTDVIKEFYDEFEKQLIEKDKIEKVNTTRLLGIDSATNLKVYASRGRYGPFVQLGEKDNNPKYASIPKNLDENSITLEEALKLFRLPRSLGLYQGNEVKVNIGKYGPYIQVNKKFYSLKEDPYTISLNRAIEIIEEEEKNKKKAIIKEFKEEGILILDGKYGPYIKKGRKNYKISKSVDPKSLTIDDVLNIIKG